MNHDIQGRLRSRLSLPLTLASTLLALLVGQWLHSSTISAQVPLLPAVVINETDYDQPGTDTAEFIELKNAGTTSVSLSGWTLELVNGANGGAVIYGTVALPAVTLSPGSYYVVCANAATVTPCDLDANPNTDFIQNGAPDAIALRLNGTLVDVVSYEGNTLAPYTEGSGAGLVDDNVTVGVGLSRCPDGSDTNVNATDFKLTAITPGATNACATDSAPSVTSITPANGAAGVALAANLSVTFSEPVNVTGEWFTLVCGGVAVPSSVSGGPTTFTIDPTANLPQGQACTLTVVAIQVRDQDTSDPPDTMASNVVSSFTTAQAIDPCTLPYTTISSIQGSGLSAAITGTVTTRGVVVGDFEYPGSGATSAHLRGFYIQDPMGDGDPATSDAIFVFNGNNQNVSLGDVVRVTGTAAEFQNQTQITASAVVACGTGLVTPTDVMLPMASPTDFERYEGMLVRLPQSLSVTEHFQLGRFGQVVLSAGGRLAQPTDVAAPGPAALEREASNTLNQLILDDTLQSQNPDPIVFGRGGQPLSASNTLRGGDTATGIVGVLTYTWAGNAASGNAFRIRPFNALGGTAMFAATNPRPTSVPAVPGTLRVVGANLLNYFNTFSGCTAGVGGATTECRGADNAIEFARQSAKTVAAILGTGGDVIGLNEMENDGYGTGSAIADLTTRLNAATAPGTWAFIDADTGTGMPNALGSDAIKVSILYKPAMVTPIGVTAALNSDVFTTGGDSGPRNRPALAQAFQQNSNGARFVLAVNHLKSKGSACDLPAVGDGQGNCNVVRTNAATELTRWLAGDPTGAATPNVLVMGDLNAYSREDPVAVLEAAGYVNLAGAFVGAGAYSYVFAGQWGSLDHALASPALAGQVSGVETLHINADEPGALDYNTEFKTPNLIASLFAADPYRAADHDPILVGLTLSNEAPVITSISPATTITLGQTTVLEAQAYDPEGGPIAYAWDFDNDGVFEREGQSVVFSGTTGVGTFIVKVRVTDQTGLSATASTTVTVQFDFTGFFSPVANLPDWNVAKAGSAVPVTFSLGGDQGLAVLAIGSPVSLPVACGDPEVAGQGEPAATPGRSTLRYDPSTDRYIYVWKTEKTWSGTCRVLSVGLVDGSTHRAIFRFR